MRAGDDEKLAVERLRDAVERLRELQDRLVHVGHWWRDFKGAHPVAAAFLSGKARVSIAGDRGRRKGTRFDPQINEIRERTDQGEDETAVIAEVLSRDPPRGVDHKNRRDYLRRLLREAWKK